ncbi:putative membrane protein, partial [Chlamydia psittaci 01DC11]
MHFNTPLSIIYLINV